MKILIGVLLAAAVLLLLPLSVRLRWNGTLAVWAGIGPLRVKVYDGAAREKKPPPPAGKTPRDRAPSPEKKPGERLDPSLLRDLAASLPAPLRRLCRRVRISGLAVRALLTGGDAAEAAVRAGRAGAVFYSLYGVLCQVFTVGEPQVLILPDFFREEDNYYIEGIVTLCPAALLAFGAGFVRRFAARQLRRRDTADREEDYGQQSKRPDGGQL